MTIEEKRRELFEAFLDEMKGKLVSGPYHDPASNAGWIAWNAALDAVVIELPGKFAADPDIGEEYDEFAMGMNTMLRNCNSAIESIGVGLKVMP